MGKPAAGGKWEQTVPYPNIKARQVTKLESIASRSKTNCGKIQKREIQCRKQRGRHTQSHLNLETETIGDGKVASRHAKAPEVGHIHAHCCKLTCFWSTKHLVLPPAARWLNNGRPRLELNSQPGQRHQDAARCQKDKDVRIAYFVKIRKYHKTHRNT